MHLSACDLNHTRQSNSQSSARDNKLTCLQQTSFILQSTHIYPHLHHPNYQTRQDDPSVCQPLTSNWSQTLIQKGKDRPRDSKKEKKKNRGE